MEKNARSVGIPTERMESTIGRGSDGPSERPESSLGPSERPESSLGPSERPESSLGPSERPVFSEG